MKLRFYNSLASLFDRLRDCFDRLHGWAIDRATNANVRQLQLNLKRDGRWLR